MFSTFVAVPPPTVNSRAQSSSQNQTVASPPVRSKRAQVSRACDMCRLLRIKCDNKPQCTSCISRNHKCTNYGATPAYTLASAIKTIEQLKATVQSLERELAICRETHHLKEVPTPPSSVSSSSSRNSAGLDVDIDSGAIEDYYDGQKLWDGINTLDKQTNRTEYYGSSSPFYFSARINSFLHSTASPAPLQLDDAFPLTPSNRASVDLSPRSYESQQEMIPGHVQLSSTEELTRSQQGYFIGLFWQSYHCMMPIICEDEFYEHYESLWPESSMSHSQEQRKASPLVDILLALCIQFGTNCASRTGLGRRDMIESHDASVAGGWYFRRCQEALVAASEKPSFTSLQCYILTVLYLSNASYTNMAYNKLGTAIRIAHSLGLHREPPSKLERCEQEMYRRVWWSLYILDVKFATELGRPWAFQPSFITCKLPMDNLDVLGLSGTKFACPIGEITWLSFHLQSIKLAAAAHSVYNTLYNGHIKTNQSVYTDPLALEEFAERLEDFIRPIEEWRRNLPRELLNSRRGSEPMSVDGTTIKIDHYAPPWLQRQRISLELQYFNILIILYRPFICFSPTVTRRIRTPLADKFATSCLKSAKQSTSIIHQVLSETDVLNGWFDAYFFQWNAALSLVGFQLAYPGCQFAPGAREHLNKAVEVFNAFAANFSTAASAASITKDLCSKVDSLVHRVRNAAPHSSNETRNDTLSNGHKRTSSQLSSGEVIVGSPTEAFPSLIETSPLSDGTRNDVSPWLTVNYNTDWTGYENDLEEIFGSMPNFGGFEYGAIDWNNNNLSFNH